MCFVFHSWILMTSWRLNIWKLNIWLYQDLKELSKWNRKFFLVSQVLFFRLPKQTSKNVTDTTFNYLCKKIPSYMFYCILYMSLNIGIPLIYGSSFNCFLKLNLTLQPLPVRVGRPLSILALTKSTKSLIGLPSIHNNYCMILSFFL